MRSADPLIGRIICSTYRIEKLCHSGGSARVYLASDIKRAKLGQRFCVKAVSKRAAGPEILSQYEQEIGLLSSIEHAGIVSIISYDEDAEWLYIVMNYVTGENLDEILRSRGIQSEADVRNWAVEILSALDYLHHLSPPVIYCDLNPKNVILDANGAIHLIDFGISERPVPGLASSRCAMGTQGFAAPEQYRSGSRILTPATDVYGMGATMMRLLTGASPKPNHTADAASLRPDLSEGMRYIISRATQPRPEARYPDAASMRSDLLALDDVTGAKLRGLRMRAAAPLIACALGLFFSAGAALSWHQLTRTRSQEAADLLSQARLTEDISEAKSLYLKAASRAQDPGSIYAELFDALASASGASSENMKTALDALRTAGADISGDADLIRRALTAAAEAGDTASLRYASSMAGDLEPFWTVLMDAAAGESEDAAGAAAQAYDASLRAEGGEALYDLYAAASLQALSGAPDSTLSEKIVSRAASLLEGSDFDAAVPLYLKLSELALASGDAQAALSLSAAVPSDLLSSAELSRQAEIASSAGDMSRALTLYRRAWQKDASAANGLALCQALIDEGSAASLSEASAVYEAVMESGGLSASQMSRAASVSAALGG